MKFIEKLPIKYIALILLLTSLLTRSIYLVSGMPSLTNDEADLYTTSYTLAKTGSDQYGNSLFLTSGFLTAKPSIPIYIGTIPWLVFSNKTIFLARLPFALLNSFTPLLFYFITLKLSKNKLLSFISFCVFNFSPWFSYLSATGYEAYIGLFFLLLSLLILLTEFSNSKKLILYFVTSFLAFNSYMGLKPIFPIISLLFLCIALLYDKQKLSLSNLGRAIFISILFFVFFVFLNYNAPNSNLIKKEYINMVSYFNQAETEGKVWFDRLTTQAPNPIKTLIANKFTVRFKDQLTKYMMTYNLAMYFQKGDPSALYGTADLSGLFFLTDFIFFIFGITQIYRIKEWTIKILLLLIFIGGIPIALSTTNPTFIMRGIILILPFSILISIGTYYSILRLKQKDLGILIFILLLSINLILYFTLYQTRIKVLSSEHWHQSEKTLSDKVALLNTEAKINVFASEPKAVFLQFAFYNIKNPQLIKNLILYHNDYFSYDNIVVQKECPQNLPKNKEIYVYKNLYCKLPLITPDYSVDDKFAIAGNKSGEDYLSISPVIP